MTDIADLSTKDGIIEGEYSSEVIVASATHIPAEVQDERSISPFNNIKSFELAQRMATALSRSTMVPMDYRGSVANCLVAMEMAHRTGISPLMVMQNMFIIQGRPSWSSQFIIAVINASGRFSPLDFVFSADGQECHCEAIRDGKVVVGPTVSFEMARAEGWSTKGGSKWKTMPDLMIRYRAAGFFGRVHAPDLLLGLYSEHESFDIAKQKLNI